jgi:hypothetical protein
MHRSVLIVGLLLMVAGIFVLNQGIQILSPIAEILGQASRVQTERLLLPPTLLTVPASDYAFLPADLQGGVSVKGSLQVSGAQEVAMYVMTEGNFSLWRAGQPTAILLAKPVAITYNFTITPQASGTYYFVFDNQDTTKRVVIFSLSVLQDTIVLSPTIEYAGYEVFAVGVVLFAIGARTGKRKPEPKEIEETGVRCKFCGARIVQDQTFCEKCGRSQQ